MADESKTIVGVRLRITHKCEMILSDDVDQELFGLANAVHVHYVMLLHRLLRLKTEDIDSSVRKRVFLFYGQLTNDIAGGLFTLATHGIRLPQVHLSRSAIEYAARAMYFSAYPDKTLVHFKDLWNKIYRINRATNITPEARATLDEQVELFLRANPDWKRPSDIGLKDIFVTLYGPGKGETLYHRYHVVLSPLVHGYIEAYPSILRYEDGTTRVNDFLNLTSHSVLTTLRLLFKFSTMMRETFRLDDPKTLDLFRAYVRVERRIARIQNPLPQRRPR